MLEPVRGGGESIKGKFDALYRKQVAGSPVIEGASTQLTIDSGVQQVKEMQRAGCPCLGLGVQAEGECAAVHSTEPFAHMRRGAGSARYKRNCVPAAGATGLDRGFAVCDKAWKHCRPSS